MSGYRPAYTPIEPNKYLVNDRKGEPVGTSRYQRLVGKLIYLSHTTINLASQFMHSLYVEFLDVVYRILRYFKSAPGKGFFP